MIDIAATLPPLYKGFLATTLMRYDTQCGDNAIQTSDNVEEKWSKLIEQ